MKDIPIIFSGPMVRALLDGRKTMTRRLLYSERKARNGQIPATVGYLRGHPPRQVSPSIDKYMTPSPWQKVKPGDRLWVRENWKPHSTYAGMKPRDIPHSQVFYASDDGYAPSNTPWVPSIHMPRWASRLTLTVTATKIERLQDISEADARAEGMPVDHNGKHYEPPAPDIDSWQGYGRASFALLWSGLHGKESWDANPDVVALTFTVAEQNIDRPEGVRHDQ